MILTTTYNNPVAAPAVDNSAWMLIEYISFSGNESATLQDLFALLITPCPERDRFLMSLSPIIALRRNNFYSQTY